ncbi:MAG: phage portal protein [Candidatus Spyradocola sp.]|jgi:SPP1 family phage portal protein
MDETQRLSLLLAGARGMTTAEIVESEIDEFRRGPQPLLLEAEGYYRNRSAVQGKKNRYRSRSNTRIEHSILRKLVDQKVNYLLARPFTLSAGSAAYAGALNRIFDAAARAEIKSLGKEAIKKGIGWVQLYIGQEGGLRFKRLPTEQIIPEWADDEHTRLDCLIRACPQVVYEGREKVLLERAELWSARGVERFVRRMGGGRLLPDVELGAQESHFAVDGKPWNWAAPPFLWVKYCEEELPLLHFVKELIDDYNWQTSVSADILRDAAQLVYVLRGYGGQNLEEFVRDLRESMAVQVDGDGGVDTIQAQLDMNAVGALLDRHRRDLYDLARSVDTQDPNLGDASGQALKFRYADLDMDCNDLEAEFQAMFQRMKPFLDAYLRLTGQGDFSGEDFAVVFNRDIIVNESEAIANARASLGLISEKTIVENHPWVEDAEEELRRRQREEAETRTELPFAAQVPQPSQPSQGARERERK